MRKACEGVRPAARRRCLWRVRVARAWRVLLAAAGLVGCSEASPPLAVGGSGSGMQAVSVTAVQEATWRWEGRREAVVSPALEHPIVAPASGVVTLLSPEGDRSSSVLARVVDEASSARIRGLRSRWSAEEELLERYRGLREEGVLLEEEWQSVRRAHDGLRAELEEAQARARQQVVHRPEGMVVVRWRVSQGSVVGAGETLGWLSRRGSALVSLRLSPVEIGDWSASALQVSCAAGAAAPEDSVVLAPVDGVAWWTLELPLAGDHPCVGVGTRVRVEAAGPVQEGMWLVPPRGVAHDAEGSWVLRVVGDGALERVPVEVVRALPGGLAVRGALDAGDRVLREDPRPREGVERVEPVEVP